MGPADYDLLSGMDPAALQKMLNLGTLDERGDLLQQQLMQAQALRGQAMPQHSTGAGAALGGLGNVLSGVSGDLQSAHINKEQGALLGQKDAGRSAYAQAIIEALRKQQVPGSAGAGDAAVSGLPFALG